MRSIAPLLNATTAKELVTVSATVGFLRLSLPSKSKLIENTGPNPRPDKFACRNCKQSGHSSKECKCCHCETFYSNILNLVSRPRASLSRGCRMQEVW